MARRTGLQAQGADDGPRIPFGDWGDQAIDWVDNRLGWLLDGVAWPVNRCSDFLLGTTDTDGLTDAPRLYVIVAFAALAYVVGGVKRAAYVGGALGVCALMGNRMWDATAETLGILVLLFIGVFMVTAAVLAALGGNPIHQPAARRTAIGWSLIPPYALLIPGVFFWGIGTAPTILTTLCIVTPLAVGAAGTSEGDTPTPGASQRTPGLVAARALHGIHSAIPFSMAVVGFLAIAGMGGLSIWLFRSVSNQDPRLLVDASVAFWLVGFVAWKMTNPWSLAHLPTFPRRHGGDSDVDNEPHAAREPVGATIGE